MTRRSRFGLLLSAGLFGTVGCDTGGEAVAVSVAKPLYEQSCAVCHGDDGRGRPPVYPPLAGHARRLLAAPGGREYLVRVPLFGLSGPIEVEGEPYSGPMASFASLDDAELAGILNYVLDQGEKEFAARIRPAEVARARRTPLQPSEVRRLRPAVAAEAPQGGENVR